MPELTLKELCRLPWSYHGPTRVVDEDGERWELTIKELPDFFLAATDRDALFMEVRPALLAFLESYVVRNETPPMPDQPGRWRANVLTVEKVEQLPRVAAPPPEVVPA